MMKKMELTCFSAALKPKHGGHSYIDWTDKETKVLSDSNNKSNNKYQRDSDQDKVLTHDE